MSRVGRACRSRTAPPDGLAFANTVLSPRAASDLYSQDPFPTEYPDGFTTFTSSIATTPCPHTSVTPPSSDNHYPAVPTSFRAHQSPHTSCTQVTVW